MSRLSIPLVLIAFIALSVFDARQSEAQDTVEMVNGRKVRGEVGEIRKEEKEFDFKLKISGRTIMRTYRFDKVHAVTMKGKRFELTPKSTPSKNSDTTRRSKPDINKLIDEVGSTPPDWFESTRLDYPKTLDLTWPLKPPTDGWRNQENMGQYIWDVINPNPNRWRPGLKLVNQCMASHRGDPVLLKRDINALASMYFRFFQDYPRAAFWLQKASPAIGSGNAANLGECYWRMGNKAMALAMVEQPRSRGRRVPRIRINAKVIKLLGDIGETQKAVDLADRFSKSRARPDAYLLAGDALRQAGRFDQAISYYQKVIDDPGYDNKDYERRFKSRARESMEAVRLFELADVSKIADGTYSASTTGYNGPITIAVKVSHGRIESVEVTNHQEKQFYSALTDTPQTIIAKQSVKGIDATSRATITSIAIVNATAKALAEKTNSGG